MEIDESNVMTNFDSLIEKLKNERDTYGVMTHEHIAFNSAISIVCQHKDGERRAENEGVAQEKKYPYKLQSIQTLYKTSDKL